MIRRALLLMIGLTLVALVACSDDDDNGTTDEATSTAPAATATTVASTPDSSDETPGANSGIPEVDDILVAVLSGDPAKMRPRIRFDVLACTTTPGPGTQPQCREGEAVGTQVNVVEVSTCEGEFRRADEVEGLTEQLQAQSLQGVYAGPASQGPDGEYIAVFNRDAAGQEGAVAVTIDGGIMVYFKFSCGETVDQLVQVLGLGEPVFTP